LSKNESSQDDRMLKNMPSAGQITSTVLSLGHSAQAKYLDYITCNSALGAVRSIINFGQVITA